MTEPRDDLRPYRERRRTRGFAAGLLLGYLAGAWILPALAELLHLGLELAELADVDSTAERVAAYTDGSPDREHA